VLGAHGCVYGPPRNDGWGGERKTASPAAQTFDGRARQGSNSLPPLVHLSQAIYVRPARLGVLADGSQVRDKRAARSLETFMAEEEWFTVLGERQCTRIHLHHPLSHSLARPPSHVLLSARHRARNVALFTKAKAMMVPSRLLHLRQVVIVWGACLTFLCLGAKAGGGGDDGKVAAFALDLGFLGVAHGGTHIDTERERRAREKREQEAGDSPPPLGAQQAREQGQAPQCSDHH
jgi:hypothetical protein